MFMEASHNLTILSNDYKRYREALKNDSRLIAYLKKYFASYPHIMTIFYIIDYLTDRFIDFTIYYQDLIPRNVKKILLILQKICKLIFNLRI